jgi:hypothetical protein
MRRLRIRAERSDGGAKVTCAGHCRDREVEEHIEVVENFYQSGGGGVEVAFKHLLAPTVRVLCQAEKRRRRITAYASNGRHVQLFGAVWQRVIRKRGRIRNRKASALESSGSCTRASYLQNKNKKNSYASAFHVIEKGGLFGTPRSPADPCPTQ